MVTRGGRGREGRSQARQGRLRGNQNRQLNCRRRSRLLCRLQPSQELPGKSRGVQSWWLNHWWRARLVTGAHLLLQPGRPGRDPDRCFQHTRLPRGRRHLDLLFFLQLQPPVTMEVPVEQVAQKRKASSLLPSQTATRPVSPPSPRRWETARSRISGRFRDYISPPVDNIADLPREPAAHVWQVLPDEMGKVNIGLAGRSINKLVITTSQGELFRQVVIDKAVEIVAHVSVAGFLSRYLSGPLPLICLTLTYNRKLLKHIDFGFFLIVHSCQLYSKFQ